MTTEEALAELQESKCLDKEYVLSALAELELRKKASIRPVMTENKPMRQLTKVLEEYHELLEAISENQGAARILEEACDLQVAIETLKCSVEPDEVKRLLAMAKVTEKNRSRGYFKCANA